MSSEFITFGLLFLAALPPYIWMFWNFYSPNKSSKKDTQDIEDPWNYQ